MTLPHLPTADLGASIDAFVDGHQEHLVQLVRDLIGIDSQIPPAADERAIVSYLQDRCDELGLGRGEIVASDERRPNLVVRVPGQGNGSTLVLNGHLDTKPIGDARHQWEHDPFAADVVDGTLYGLGASDMKAAVGAMVYSVYALRQLRIALQGNVVLALVADEEAGATYGSRFLAPRLAGNVDACLIGEPSGWETDWQGLHLISRGLCCFQVRVHGTQMHSSLSDRMPSVNANLDMAEIMLRLRDGIAWECPPQDLPVVAPTINVGVTVQGGVFYGVVPGEAVFGCDLRTLPGMTEESVHRTLEHWRASLRASDGRRYATDIVYEPQLGWIPPAQIAADHPLVAAVRAAATDVLGEAPPLSVFPGTTDAPWYEAVGIPTLPSFGPGILTRCHGPNERVSIASICQAAKIYARTLVGYLGCDA